MKISIAAPDIHTGDAVGNHCLALALDFAERGHDCHLFAQRYTSTDQIVRPIADLISGQAKHSSQDLLLVSFSIYDPNLRRLLKLPGRKIAYFHGITPPGLLVEHDPKAAYYCERGYGQLSLLSEFDHIVTNSDYNLRELQQQMQVQPAVEDLSVIPPISARYPLFSQANIPLTEETLANPLQLLSVGRVVPHKRIEDLIEVVSLLNQNGIRANLDIVGSCDNASYRSCLQDMVDSFELQGQVHLHGMVSIDRLAMYYQDADLLLVASLHEGFCIPVLEAMHLGLPVMVRSGTAASEVLNLPLFEHTTPLSFAMGIQGLTKNDLDHARRAGYKQAQTLLQSASLDNWQKIFFQAR